MTRLLFASFDVTKQVFYRSSLCFGLVNLKPIVPGHVLVVPNRVVPRLMDLTHEEVSDVFATVQKVGKVIEKEYGGESLTIACQDGPAAGQSVPHVHVHIIPRRFVDFEGNNDRVYPALQASDRSLDEDLQAVHSPDPAKRKVQDIKVDNDSRAPRSMEEMEKEAIDLSKLF